MNRQELKEKIERLPLFEKRDIRVRDRVDQATGEFVDVTGDKAICEVDQNKPCAFVGPRYTLLQFSEVFKPILDGIEGEIDGEILNYGGYAAIYVYPDEKELNEGDNKFGLVAINSVDCSSSVIVKFCVERDGRRIVIPPKVAGLKKSHNGKVGSLVKNYMRMVGKVKEAWNTIVEEFPKYSVVYEVKDGQENAIAFDDCIGALNLDGRLSKRLKAKKDVATAYGRPFTLWDMFVQAVDVINDRNYKSEVHRQKKIDTLCEAIFKYAVVLQL